MKLFHTKPALALTVDDQVVSVYEAYNRLAALMATRPGEGTIVSFQYTSITPVFNIVESIISDLSVWTTNDFYSIWIYTDQHDNVQKLYKYLKMLSAKILDLADKEAKTRKEVIAKQQFAPVLWDAKGFTGVHMSEAPREIQWLAKWVQTRFMLQGYDRFSTVIEQPWRTSPTCVVTNAANTIVLHYDGNYTTAQGRQAGIFNVYRKNPKLKFNSMVSIPFLQDHSPQWYNRYLKQVGAIFE